VLVKTIEYWFSKCYSFKCLQICIEHRGKKHLATPANFRVLVKTIEYWFSKCYSFKCLQICIEHRGKNTLPLSEHQGTLNLYSLLHNVTRIFINIHFLPHYSNVYNSAKVKQENIYIRFRYRCIINSSPLQYKVQIQMHH